MEVYFNRAAFDAHGGELGFGPSADVEVDVVGVLVEHSSGDGSFPEVVLNLQWSLYPRGFPFAVGGTGGDGADDRADPAGIDQAAFDP